MRNPRRGEQRRTTMGRRESIWVVVLVPLMACGSPKDIPFQDTVQPPMVVPDVVSTATQLTTVATTAGGPYDRNATMSDKMIVDPTTATPGGVVALRFPDERLRGIGFVLERETGNGWVLEYLLTSRAGDPQADAKYWATPDEHDAWPDLGVTGPGPEYLDIPPVAEPGHYRICTANSIENICARELLSVP